MVTKRKRVSEPNAKGGIPTQPSGVPPSDSVRVDQRERRAPKPHKRRWPFIVVGAFVAVVLVVVALFSWDRWLRYDDMTEIQGEWQIQGSTGVVVIDGQQIKLTEDVGYSYALDAGAKTLSFSFGTMTGEGRYRFSLDRSQLVIMDGSSYSWFSTLADDVAWMVDQAVRAVQGHAPEDVQADDDTTVLDRLSRDASATPREGTAAPVEETPTKEAPAEQAPAEEPPSTSDDAQGDADPGVPAVPSDIFDVNDIPA